jgi:hypothetical protein
VARAALLVVALVFWSACKTVAPAVPLPSDDPRPAALLKAWGATAGARHALRGRLHLAVDGYDGEVRFRGNQIVALERPARLRVEVLGFLNQTAAVIATDGERFEVFRSDDRSYQTGGVYPGLLMRQAHLALTPGEAVEVLLGAPAPGAGLVPAQAVAAGGDLIRMDLVDSEQRVRQRAAFDADSRLREFEVVDEGGAVRWRARFGDHEVVGETFFPHTIVLDVTTGDTHVEISLRDVELNPRLAPGVFQLRDPAGQQPREGPGG